MRAEVYPEKTWKRKNPKKFSGFEAKVLSDYYNRLEFGSFDSINKKFVRKQFHQ